MARAAAAVQPEGVRAHDGGGLPPVDETLDSVETWAEDAGTGAPPEVLVSCGRYRLGPLLGKGGFGQVHRAEDTLTGEQVAIKFVTALSVRDLERTRRELAALRWLRLPGVVRLRDDGSHGPDWFLVMDLVEGHALRPAPWSEFGPWLLQLLEVLARVHLAGVLHLDLKPNNLVVTPAGRVVVLDFGIARGRALPEAPKRVEGTPKYMAPEQLGGRAVERSDLYAVGVMAEELCADLPPDVARVVQAMRHPDPDQRPADALAAYRAIAGRSPLPPALERDRPWTRDELRDLFGGGDRFTHLASDAADLLWERTGGDPGQVATQAEAAVLEGVLGWEGGRLSVDRNGLERWSGRVTSALLQGERVTAAVDAARELRRRGRLASAVALVEAALAVPGADTRELLAERVLVAIMLQTPLELDLALYSLERAAPSADVHHLSALVRRFRATLRKERELAASIAVAPFEDPELEIRRQACFVSHASQRGAEVAEETLRALEPWAGEDHERRAVLAGWWGRHWYNLGAFRDAAGAHERASDQKVSSIGRLSSTLAAAAAWAEVPDLQRSAALAERAAADAAALRHPRFEAYATWMLRTVAYRAGRAVPPSADMLRAIGDAGADLEAPFAATDAAAAWRLGDLAGCAVLADHAARKFVESGFTPGAAMMRALAGFCRGESLDALVPEVTGCRVPDVELQVLAFARWSADPGPEPDRWLARGRELGSARGTGNEDVRLDVLSVAEALADEPPEVGRG